jgi:small subunit ribosomal protein S1
VLFYAFYKNCQNLSVKAKDSAEEKAAMEDYNKQSSNAVEGATLGDLLKQAKD